MHSGHMSHSWLNQESSQGKGGEIGQVFSNYVCKACLNPGCSCACWVMVQVLDPPADGCTSHLRRLQPASWRSVGHWHGIFSGKLLARNHSRPMQSLKGDAKDLINNECGYGDASQGLPDLVCCPRPLEV